VKPREKTRSHVEGCEVSGKSSRRMANCLVIDDVTGDYKNNNNNGVKSTN